MILKPMILCRTNKQVKTIEEERYFEVSTIHQAKGLEYPNVIVIDTTISNSEDLNIAYVAMTRAENNLLVINWTQFEHLFKMYMNKNSFGGV
jgi:ATP-dependent exoDNAse (exonuclease V) beta subunit